MAKHETVTTPMGEGYGSGGANPSGKVCTDAESTVKGLPGRTKGPGQIEEVIYDENMGIPHRSGGK